MGRQKSALVTWTGTLFWRVTAFSVEGPGAFARRGETVRCAGQLTRERRDVHPASLGRKETDVFWRETGRRVRRKMCRRMPLDKVRVVRVHAIVDRWDQKSDICRDGRTRHLHQETLVRRWTRGKPSPMGGVVWPRH